MSHGLALAAAVLALTAAPCAGEAQDRSLEYPVKAAFLYKFGSFVEWPADAFSDPRAPLQLCVVGRDPFGQILDGVVQGQTVGGRPIKVRRLSAVSAASGCHIAYLGGSPDQSVSAAAKALSGAPVLTIAEGSSGGERAAIEFVVKANRVRFRVDMRPTAASRLSISSKLLNLAVEVAR
jgi:hypothetical protein